MTNEQINAAIATACGWTNVHPANRSGKAPGTDYTSNYEHIPDYCNDLNAMHQAEGALSDGDLWTMKYNLPLQGDLEFRSTARQRAEAFLRTLDKWKSEN